MRGRKRLHSPQGRVYDLDAVFEDLNRRFFHGLLGRPRMSWSPTKTRRILGHYDPAHNAIVISRIFDQFRFPATPWNTSSTTRCCILKHPVRLRGSRRCVHSAEFHAEEKFFPQLEQAEAFLKRL